MAAIKRRSKFPDIPNLDQEFDNLIRQIEDSPSQSGTTQSIAFFSSATSGGAVTQLNTIYIKDGKITSWEQTNP